MGINFYFGPLVVMHCSAFAKRVKYSLLSLRNLAPQAPCRYNGGYFHAAYLCCIAVPMLHCNLVVTYEFENSYKELL